ncbi:MAG: c-type cytochrome, partial [Chloroflexota bacterium]
LVTALGLLGIISLTVLAWVEAPPPSEAIVGDPTALLYTENCAGCHVETLNVPTGTNLHEVIAQGNHEGMPPWNADLTDEEIDALAGFILFPAGSNLFLDNCNACHTAVDLVAIKPLELKNALEDGVDYPAHLEVDVPDWPTTLEAAERTSLLNLLIAPDGQRLFTTNCSACHGYSASFSGTSEDLRETIVEGGLHLEMPGWQGKLSSSDIGILANYVLDPGQNPAGIELYQENCTDCHYDLIPTSESYDIAYEAIETGGTHETMPVWGDILTEEQIDALATYAYESAQGTSRNSGRRLYVENCASCHGVFGEGGPNPSQANDIIAPISTAEYLKTRD